MVNKNLLKSMYIAKGLTQSVLARKLGISVQSLSAKINNNVEFRSSEIAKLCDLLNIDSKDMSIIFFNYKVDKNLPKTV